MSTVVKTLYIGLAPALQRTTVYRSLKIGAVNRAMEQYLSAGGKGANAMRAFQKIGGRGSLLSLVGGEQGQAFVRVGAFAMHEELPVVGDTRTCHTLIDVEGATTTELVEETAPLRAEEVRAFFEWLAQRDLRGQVAMCGRLPTGMPTSTYAQIAAKTHSVGGSIYIDSVGKPLLEALHTHPIVKINREELIETIGISSPHEAAREMLARGAKGLLLTHADQAAYLYEADRVYRMELPSVKGLNTTGCGDAVMGGLLYQRARGKPLLEAAAYALACGSAAAGTVLPADIDPEVLAKIYPQCSRYSFKAYREKYRLTSVFEPVAYAWSRYLFPFFLSSDP